MRPVDKDLLIALLGSGFLTSLVALVGHIMTHQRGRVEFGLAIEKLRLEMEKEESAEEKQAREEERTWRRDQVATLLDDLRRCKDEWAQEKAALKERIRELETR